MSLAGKIALVTGASRGIGRGIALQLGEAGATVYVTGRKPAASLSASQSDLPTLLKTADEVTERGGKGIAVYCDHADPDDIKQLFERIASETQGVLDILVNNAYSGVTAITESQGKKFWETEPLIWDEINNVGLRNHYICAVYASRLMVARGKGLIITISSAGGLRYLFNVAYGVGKAANDRMAADMAHELYKYGVTAISLWPGAVRTELITKFVDSGKFGSGSGKGEMSAATVKNMFENGETIEYSGKAVVALATDSNVLDKTGRVLITGDLGREYGFLDIDGRSPPTIRSVKAALQFASYHRLASWIPEWVRVPGWMITASVSKL
uniref:Dehydrogenase/reductase SDR family member 1 n=1 Tax=Plectus sambesii TaxID=2011161 RepID=A0A914WP64_9BILA